MKQTVKIVCACAFVGLTAGFARGATAFDNLGPANAFLQVYGAIGDINGNVGEEAMQFVPTNTIKLSSLDLALGTSLSGTGPGKATVELHLDSNGLPGTLVDSWTTSTITSLTGAIESLASSKGTTLAAGQKYWITVARAPGSTLGGGWFMSAMPSYSTVITAKRTTDHDWTEIDKYRGYALRVSGAAQVAGDANEDGKVNADDYALLDRGFRRHLSGWNNGDFNGDNVVDSLDYLMIDVATASQGGLAGTFLAERAEQFGDAYVAQLVAAVPEPTTATVVAGLAMLGLRRRRQAAAR